MHVDLLVPHADGHGYFHDDGSGHRPGRHPGLQGLLQNGLIFVHTFRRTRLIEGSINLVNKITLSVLVLTHLCLCLLSVTKAQTPTHQSQT